MKLVVDNGPRPVMTPQRKSLLAQVHIAQKQLGMQKDDYRALVERVTGHRSAADCTDGQLRDIIAECERMGFRSTAGRNRRIAGGSKTVRKAQAMWISLYQLGAVKDGSSAALDAFGRRQLRVDRLEWSNERQGFRLIEALKAIADRYGWDQRVPARLDTAARIRLLKDRLVGAQLARLAAAGVELTGPITQDRTAWSEKRLENAAAELAPRVRSIPKNTSPSESPEAN